MVREFHVSELWWRCSKFPCAWGVLIHFLFGCDPSAPVSWWLELFFSCRLTREYPTSNFESGSIQFLGACPTPFLSSSFPGLTRDPKLCEEISSLHGLCIRLISLAVAVGEPLFEVASCLRFDMAPITMRSLIWERKLLKWLQEYIEKLIMLNKQSRWSHSSFEKLPLIRMSASWFLVSTYLIWILGSKLILSNNLSRATLWVLDTCLIVGLRPLIIILITASLSSKMYDWDSP